MVITKEQLEAQRLIEQKKAADKALLKAGVKPKLHIVKGRQSDGDFSPAFAKALEEYETRERCPKCSNERPDWGGPYCDCEIGQSTLRSHRRTAEAEKTRQWAREAERRKQFCEKLQKVGGFVVPKRYQSYTPRTLQALIGQREWNKEKNEDLRATVDIAIAWADGKLERPGLLISGDYGVGKSALCFWAVRRRTAQTDEAPLLIRYRQFIDIVQDCYRKGSENRKLDFIMGAQQAEILMLDDFGQVNLPVGEEAKPDKQEIMLEVLDYRTQHGLSTLIATNLTQARLMAQFNGAITGRLMELCQWVEMGGIDLRKKGTIGW